MKLYMVGAGGALIGTPFPTALTSTCVGALLGCCRSSWNYKMYFVLCSGVQMRTEMFLMDADLSDRDEAQSEASSDPDHPLGAPDPDDDYVANHEPEEVLL